MSTEGLWVPVPIDLINDYRLDACAIAIYAALASFADFNSGEAYPSVRTIAHRAGCSPRTVHSRLRLLDSIGWVHKYSGKETGTSNRYLVVRADDELLRPGPGWEAPLR